MALRAVKWQIYNFIFVSIILIAALRAIKNNRKGIEALKRGKAAGGPEYIFLEYLYS